jgi:hypothetical protein
MDDCFACTSKVHVTQFAMTLERVLGELVLLLQEIEKYVQEDPYVLNGLVLSWYVSKICLESAGMHGVLTGMVPRLCCLPGTTSCLKYIKPYACILPLFIVRYVLQLCPNTSYNGATIQWIKGTDCMILAVLTC